jgi:hypothetical protein
VTKLKEIKIKRAAVMIFTTNQRRVLEVSANAKKNLDGLPYFIVQSVEKEIPRSESYATLVDAPWYVEIPTYQMFAHRPSVVNKILVKENEPVEKGVALNSIN